MEYFIVTPLDTSLSVLVKARSHTSAAHHPEEYVAMLGKKGWVPWKAPEIGPGGRWSTGVSQSGGASGISHQDAADVAKILIEAGLF